MHACDIWNRCRRKRSIVNVCTSTTIPTRTLDASHFTTSAGTLAATSTCFYFKLSCKVRQNIEYTLESATNAPWEKTYSPISYGLLLVDVRWRHRVGRHELKRMGNGHPASSWISEKKRKKRFSHRLSLSGKALSRRDPTKTCLRGHHSSIYIVSIVFDLISSEDVIHFVGSYVLLPNNSWNYSMTQSEVRFESLQWVWGIRIRFEFERTL